MKDYVLKGVRAKMVAAMGCAAIGAICWGSPGPAQGQNAVPNLPPGVNDVVKLTKAGLSEDVILAQVKNTGAGYNLSADQLIYLTQAGVSQNVIKALIANAPASPAPAMANNPPQPFAPPSPMPPIAPPPMVAPPGDATAPAVAPTYDTFHDQLAPYGTWVQEAGFGTVWRPTVATFDVNWRPYGDAGHWIYTDAGWSWESDYPWGGVAFHYGRWRRDNLGWVWVPGYDWAPAWVAWRHTDGYLGWAPLPPEAVFRAGVGLEFGGRLALDVDFGLAADAFLFVDYGHFWDRDLRGFFLPRDRADLIFRRSVVANGYRMDHGWFFVEGLGRDRVGLLTHHEVRLEAPAHDFRDVRRVEPDRRGMRDDRPNLRDNR
jgi:hypothetical protein